ncbi:hypothetical protein COCNU_16G003060 [Cocos nucifera]|uniref:Uncharacterized protein n=1 Tax=Cocos nucifera TaxID=13894 RepID=A0A8K0NDX8_COCNU|nr:hypothetical protein COCNU_16G003060 [Cocos nucifera]
MGCGGSKQQDVATGNTVSTGKLSQKEAAASKSKASSTTTTDVSSVDDSSNSIVEKAEMAEINGGLQGKEKATTLTVVEVTEEEQLITSETPNEYLSPRKDAELVETKAGGQEVDYLSPSKDYDASVVEEDGMEKELKEIETKAQEEEKEEGIQLANVPMISKKHYLSKKQMKMKWLLRKRRLWERVSL